MLDIKLHVYFVELKKQSTISNGQGGHISRVAAVSLFAIIFLTKFLPAWYSKDSDPLGWELYLALELPRNLTAIGAGATLALAGYLVQILVRNPLGDPYLLGTSAGASLGANLSMIGILPSVISGWYISPLYGFIGAIGSQMLILTLTRRSWDNTSSQSLVLNGVALGSILGAINTLVIYLSSESNKLRAVIFWSLGSMERSDWYSAALLMIVALVLASVTLFNSDKLLVYQLGNVMAKQLGLSIKKMEWLLIVLAGIGTSFVVSWCGVIGFIGLIVPYLSQIHGKRPRMGDILQLSLLGGFTLLSADVLSRAVYPPAGIPIGAITALMGVPIFVYLLRQKAISGPS